MKEPDPIIFVIDDDRLIRKGRQSLIRSVGLRVETFASAQDFLAAKLPDAPSCLVLDVRMPGLSGLDLQLKLNGANIQIPIIFITGHGDIPMSVRAMKEGAHEFLTKPVRGQDLLGAVQKTIASDRELRKERAELDEIRIRFQSLTVREKEVLDLVVAGIRFFRSGWRTNPHRPGLTRHLAAGIPQRFDAASCCGRASTCGFPGETPAGSRSRAAEPRR
jgi:FixJ family two-component response regulator